MGRLIDEDIVIDIINFECGKWTGLSKTIEKEIKALPSAQLEHEKGEWIQKRLNYDNDVWIRWECSRCGYLRKNGWKYILEAKKPEALFCEMCGADMRGKRNEID